MKKILQCWLRLQFKLVSAFGLCVDIDTTFEKIYAIEADDVFVVTAFE